MEVEHAFGQRIPRQGSQLANGLNGDVLGSRREDFDVRAAGNPHLDASCAAVNIPAQISHGAYTNACTSGAGEVRKTTCAEIGLEEGCTRTHFDDGVTCAVLVPGAKNAFDCHVAEAGAAGDDVRDLDGERARFVAAFQEPGFAGDNRGRGTTFGHFTDDLHQVARLEVEVAARLGVGVQGGETHAGSAGSVFQEHHIGGGIREGDPAFQVHGHTVVGDLKGQSRHLRDALERGGGAAANAGTGNQYDNRRQTGEEPHCPFRREPICHSCHLSAAPVGSFRADYRRLPTAAIPL